MEKAKTQTRSKSGQNYNKQLIYKANQPVKFTFNSSGQVIYKKKIDVEKLPDYSKQELEIKGVTSARVLVA